MQRVKIIGNALRKLAGLFAGKGKAVVCQRGTVLINKHSVKAEFLPQSSLQSDGTQCPWLSDVQSLVTNTHGKTANILPCSGPQNSRDGKAAITQRHMSNSKHLTISG